MAREANEMQLGARVMIAAVNSRGGVQEQEAAVMQEQEAAAMQEQQAVVPAEAGTQCLSHFAMPWIPASAGMTICNFASAE